MRSVKCEVTVLPAYKIAAKKRIDKRALVKFANEMGSVHINSSYDCGVPQCRAVNILLKANIILRSGEYFFLSSKRIPPKVAAQVRAVYGN